MADKKELLRDDPLKIVKKFDALKLAESALEDRWTKDFSRWRLDQYYVDSKEGKYDNYTSNGPAILGNKTVAAIAQSDVQIKISLTDEKLRERKEVTNTEDACAGIINLINDGFLKREEPSIIDQLTWYACHRGSYYQYFILRKDSQKVGKKTKDITVPELRIWDPLNTKKVIGKNGLKYIIHKRFASIETIMDEYDISEEQAQKGQTTDKQGVVYIFVDDQWEKVIIGDDWASDGFEHGLGYCPAMGYKVGSTPLIQDDANVDAYTMQGESVFENDRSLYESKNRLMSYHITIAGLLAHSPLKLLFDSTKGDQPVVNGNPWVKDQAIPLDVGKGQDMVEMDKRQLPTGFMDALQLIGREESQGGISPVAFGFADSAMPVGTTNMLIHGAKESFSSRIKAVKLGLEWICSEFIAQLKLGGWPKLKLTGKGNLNKPIDIEVGPNDIENKWKVECNLTPNLPQDVLTQTQIADTWSKSGLASKQTSRELLPIRDPDSEQDIIDREQANEIPVIKYREMITELQEDGQDEAANALLKYVERQEAQQNAPQGQQGQPGQQTPPGGQAVNAEQGSTKKALMQEQTRQVPPEVKAAMQKMSVGQRLKKMGLVKG